MIRTRIAQGIYRDQYGYAVTWRDRGRQREKRFAPDTPIATMKAFRKRQQKTATEVVTVVEGGGGSFVRDVVRFLKTRKHRECYKSDRSHMRPWLRLFGRFSRHAITKQQIKAAITSPEWCTKKPRELRHRVNILRQFFLHHDGDEAPTPCDGLMNRRSGLAELKIKKTRPQGVPGGDTLIAQVAARLAHQERIGRLRDGKTRARFLVLATCGKRPCQMQRATPNDVNFDTRIWEVAPAKNSDGGPLYLNDEMLAAWTAFVAADAWSGPANNRKKYDSRSFSKTLKRNGWDAKTRPYRMRHQTLQTMSNLGVDFGDVQQAAGHASPETTRRSYVPHEVARSKAASLTIDNRFGAVTDKDGNPVDIFAAREPKKYDKPTVAAAMARAPMGTTPS